jgi:adhesin transport system membrane fusion protein
MSLASLNLDEGISHEGVLRRSALFVFALAAVVAGLVGWASFASVDKVVRAEGRIIPSTKSQVIQHLEGGIVAAISVKEGDYVHRDQVLASIDPTRADATLAERKSKRLELQARAARLSAEAEGAASLRLPPGLTNATPQVRSELDAFTSRRDRVLQEQRVLREQVQQRRAELAEQESRARSLTGEAEVARRQLALVQLGHRGQPCFEAAAGRARRQGLQVCARPCRRATSPCLGWWMPCNLPLVISLHCRQAPRARPRICWRCIWWRRKRLLQHRTCPAA